MVLSKNSRWLLLGSGTANSWSVLLRGLRAKCMILVSVGFDSSLQKPPSSGLLKCLGDVSTFSDLFVPHDSIVHFLYLLTPGEGVLWVSVLPYLNPKEYHGISAWDRVPVDPVSGCNAEWSIFGCNAAWNIFGCNAEWK